MKWIADLLERSCSSASLDNEGDRLAVATAFADELAKRCKLCYADLRGKAITPHFADPKDARPCRGSYPL